MFKIPSVRNWLYNNFLGWFLGVITGPFLFDQIIIGTRYIPKIDEDLFYDDLALLFFSFPFGIFLGIMQKKYFQHQGISAPEWVFITAAGIGIPITLTFNFINYYAGAAVFHVLNLLVIGALVGCLQAISIRSFILKKTYWILSYSLGFPLLGIVASLLAEHLYQLSYMYQFTRTFDVLSFLFTGIIFSIFATAIIGIPTGAILRSSNKRNNINNNNLATLRTG